MKVGIVGLGLMGGSLALELKASCQYDQILGFDQSAPHAAQALALGLVQGLGTLEELIVHCDLLALCIPVNALEHLLPKVLDPLSDSQIVMDLGSTKTALCERVRNHPKRSRYVATHPMAGTEHSGPTAAFLGLFRGKTTVICESELSAPDALDEVKKVYRHLGMRITLMDAEAHDLHVAYISHLSHATSFALANTVLDKERDVVTLFELASSGFESTARLAKSSPEMWQPIFMANRGPILRALRAYEGHFSAFREALEEEDASRLTSLMESANTIRKVLSRMSAPKASPEREPDLESLRAQIDSIDAEVIRLLAKRREVTLEIGRYKATHQLPTRQPARWEAVIQSRQQQARSLGVNESMVTQIFEAIHEQSIKDQEK